MLYVRMKYATVVFFITLASNPALADDARFKTTSGWELSGQFSRYKYEEPGLMNEKGGKLGIAGGYTALLHDDFFLSANIRLASGKNTYTGSGTMSGAQDTLWEGRIILGQDYVMDRFALSPYAGIGYRQLANDLRGVTSTGARGYRRQSQYLYLPIGLTHRMVLRYDHAPRIATTLEYDLFLSGTQTSYLSDAGLGYPDISNHQRGGHGLKASIAYEMQHWSFGIFADYWKIPQSDSTYFFVGNFLFVGWEPDNNTHETGVFTKYRF